MKVVKTYGIHGLLEWHGIVDSNGVKMKVDFTNGSVTAWGVAPATFTTSNALVQHIMENSDQFKGGRIKLVSKSVIPGGDDPTPSHTSDGEGGSLTPDPSPTGEGSENTSDDEVGADVQVVEVTCLDDAKDYLADRCGESRSKLRSKQSIIDAGKKHGIEFSGI